MEKLIMDKLQRYIVVDDDRTNNLICKHVIKNWDSQATIQLFLEPEEALKSIVEDRENYGIPTLLFVDINMPTMTGWEFLETFKTFEENLRKPFTIFILTSSIEDFSKEAKRFPFVSGFLSKPLKRKNLEQIIQDLEEVQISKR